MASALFYFEPLTLFTFYTFSTLYTLFTLSTFLPPYGGGPGWGLYPLYLSPLAFRRGVRGEAFYTSRPPYPPSSRGTTDSGSVRCNGLPTPSAPHSLAHGYAYSC